MRAQDARQDSLPDDQGFVFKRQHSLTALPECTFLEAEAEEVVWQYSAELELSSGRVSPEGPATTVSGDL